MTRIDAVASILVDRVPFELNASLAPLTTYRIGGPAAIRVRPQHFDDLELVRKAVLETGVDVVTIGKGSNMLISDNGFDGVALTLEGEFDEMTIDETTIRCGAAMSLPVVARKTAALGLAGFEWAVGIPGSVGGAVRMNAGGHGAETSEVLKRCSIVDIKSDTGGIREVESLQLRYRGSNVKSSEVVAWAEFALSRGDVEKSQAEISSIVKWRREHQPGGRNVGSVFANPEGTHAGKLIDELGLRGFRIGTAEVSPKHANFIQADDGASSADVLAVIREVRRRVFDRTGIWLRHEVRFVGFADADLDGIR